MEPKIFFWIDNLYVHFFLAKALQENINCKLFGLFEVTDKPKKYFEKQNLVKFEKIWFYYDYIKKIDKEPDLEYLQKFEKKYNINLWKTAFNDRFFNRYNQYYKFTNNEILIILEQECKFYENVLDEIKPDYLISYLTHQQHNHIFYELCKSKGIEILLLTPAHIGGDKWIISDIWDKFLPLEDNPIMNKDNFNLIEPREYLLERKERRTAEIMNKKFNNSKSQYVKAAFKYIFSSNSNPETHYTYYGRSKLKVIWEMFCYEIRKKYRASFMEKNLKKSLPNEPFIYFPLHQEIESNLLIRAPFQINQVETIKQVAQSIPLGYKLLVKDHKVMSDRGWRSVKDSKEITKLPNVELLHPNIDSNDIFPKCSLVISIGGSSSIEAAFYKKPSISFRKIGHFRLPSMNVVESIPELSNVIKKSLETKVNENDVKRFLNRTISESFDFSFFELMVELYEKNNFSGFLADNEFLADNMKEFYIKNENELKNLALEHVKKINSEIK